MKLLEWKESYNLGIKELDEHHQILAAMLNRTYAAVKLNNTFAINSIVRELINYAGYHFATEENMMDAFNFPGLEHHRKEHGRFSVRITEFEKSLQEEIPLFKIEIVVFLQEWFVTHIQGIDRRCAVFLAGRGLS